MRLRWISVGLLTISSAIFAQSFPQNSGSGDAPADEPGRAVARLGILSGDASVRRGDSSEWVAAAVNAPLMSGDELAVSAGSRAEIQLDAAHFVRVAGDTELKLSDLENGHFQVQLSHGLVTWQVLRDSQAQAEISTPLVAVHPGRQSVVRVEVLPDGTTRVTVRRGDAEVSSPRGSERVRENSAMVVRGSNNDPEFQVMAAAPRDEWDSWGEQRDTYLTKAQSPRYVTEDVTGVEDLDSYGKWDYDPAYGNVWSPTVAANWAPYRDGHWVWEDYYGWTWVDYAPWGWAPFHYGYWYERAGFGWSWYPGARGGRNWWRPAMVGFFGYGNGFGGGFGFGNIGWIPLFPRETFHPWYGRGGWGGRNGGVNINIVNNTNIYNNFRNAGSRNGVTAVTAGDFQRGNFHNNIAVDRSQLQQASLVRGAVPMQPTSQNLRFNDRAPAVQAPRMNGGAVNQRFFSKSGAGTAAARTPFVQQQAAVRSAFGGQNQAQVQGQVPGRMQSQPMNTSPQGSQQNAAPQNRAGSPGWQRFENSPSPSPNSGAGAAPGWNRFNSTPNGAQQNGPQRQQAPQNYPVSPQGQSRQFQQEPQRQYPQGSQQYPQTTPRQFQQEPSRQYQQASPRQYPQASPRQEPQASPRQYQVAPPIVRERQQMQYAPQARPQVQQQQSQPRQSAPPPSQSGGYRGAPQVQRSAPGGGDRQSSGSRGEGRR